jgi:hypothetical protein
MGHSEITNDNSSPQYCMKNNGSNFQKLFDKEGKIRYIQPSKMNKILGMLKPKLIGSIYITNTQSF